jgi:hypothetical protein
MLSTDSDTHLNIFNKVDVKISRLNIILINTLLIIILILLYYLYEYPLFSDFDFVLLAKNATIIYDGHIDTNNPYSLILILISTISLITSLDLISTISIPIFLILIPLLLISIFHRLTKRPIIGIILVLIFILSPLSNTDYRITVHGSGLIMLLVIILLLIIKIEINKLDHSKIFFILLILIVISLNYISYKILFVVLCMFLFIILFQYITVLRKNQERNLNLTILSVIGLVYLFAYNDFFYDEFLPVMYFDSNLSFIDLISSFVGQERPLNNDLIQYLVSQPSYVYNTSLVRMIILSILSIIFILYFIYNLFTRDKVPVDDIIGISGIISGVIVALIYFYLGCVELNIIFLLMIVGFSIMMKYKRIKKYLYLSLILLLVVVVSGLALSISSSYHYGYREEGSFSYLDGQSGWMDNKIDFINNSYYLVSTDIFSKGYLDYYISENRSDRCINSKIFNSDDIVKICNSTTYYSDTQGNNFYLLNTRLTGYSIANWVHLDPWNNHIEKVYSNPNYDVIYNSNNSIVIK